MPEPVAIDRDVGVCVAVPQIMKMMSNSNDYVMAFGATFSTAADSHLVCMQNEQGSYETQAINIQNKPRKSQYPLQCIAQRVT